MRRLAVLVVFVLLSACVSAPCPPPVAKPEAVTAVYRAAQWGDLPDWPGDQLLASWPAWLQSCKQLDHRAEWKPICSEARALAPVDAQTVRAFFERYFAPWQLAMSNGENSGLITGYYEALLKGGTVYKPGRVPLYGVPDDMLALNFGTQYPELKGLRLRGRLDGRSVVPYWSRRDIDGGKLAGSAKVLAWVDDPLDALFLQVQGSGRVQLDDGSLLRLGYADQNGHPYRAIGKWLVEQGELGADQVTMQSIRAWAAAHPARVPELLQSNPSYVFFKIMPAATAGAVGSLGVSLTDGASIAVDPQFIPLGSPVYLATTRPDDQRALHRLVQAQDTGGAIRGAIRADYYWGFGPAAAELAGAMKQRGQLWLLWPKGLSLPVPTR
jgi:membrane-bound lytic murein transglycosylase A